MTTTTEKPIREFRATSGSSYFGSGGYSAGWKVLDGEVEATPIAGSEYDNGFVSTTDYLLRPKTPIATLHVWCGDGISSNGHRSLGPEGNIVMVRDDSMPAPKTCPHCGHVLESMSELTEAEEARRGELIAKALKLRKEKGYLEDRWVTQWGSKTNLGLFRIVQRFILDGE